MNKQTHEMLSRLENAGISQSDAFALRRISMTLHRWHELECGNDTGCIERDDATGKAYWLNANSGRRYAIRDMEKGAIKRLSSIMARYPAMSSYIQGDPRGASLYILRAGDIPEGCQVDAYYNRGIAVYS